MMGSEDRLIFIGTGCSTGLPQLNHILNHNLVDLTCSVEEPQSNPFHCEKINNPRTRSRAAESVEKICNTCLSANLDENSPNRRNNVSILLQTGGYNILFDCGKTFREAALKQFSFHKISKIDCIILTHGHEDAAGGIDEVRTIQEWDYYQDPNAQNLGTDIEAPIICDCLRPMPLFLSLATLEYIHNRFPYIMEASKTPDHQYRKISTFQFSLLSDSLESEIDPLSSPSTIPDYATEAKAGIVSKNQDGFSEIRFEDSKMLGFSIQAVPVYHGGEYKCLAYIFGKGRGKVVFLSDVSAIPAKTEKILRTLDIKVLILDCLFLDRPNYSHFCLTTGLEWVEKLAPENAFFVGMHCSLEHNWGCTFLKNWLRTSKVVDTTKRIELAYDGLVLPIDF